MRTRPALRVDLGGDTRDSGDLGETKMSDIDDSKLDDTTQNIDPQEHAKLQQRLVAAQNEAAANKRMAEKYRDVDLDEYTALQKLKSEVEAATPDELAAFKKLRDSMDSDEDRRAFEDGGMDAWFNRRTAKQQEQYEAKVRGYEQQIEALEKEKLMAVHDKREQALQIEVQRAVVSNQKIVEKMDDFILFKMQPYIKWDGDVLKLIDPLDGLELVSPDDANKPMSVAEFVDTHLPKIAPQAFKPSEGGGARGSGDGRVTDNPFLDARRLGDQLKLRNTNPEHAKRLADAARAQGKASQIKAAGV